MNNLADGRSAVEVKKGCEVNFVFSTHQLYHIVLLYVYKIMQLFKFATYRQDQSPATVVENLETLLFTAERIYKYAIDRSQLWSNDVYKKEEKKESFFLAACAVDR